MESKGLWQIEAQRAVATVYMEIWVWQLGLAGQDPKSGLGSNSNTLLTCSPTSQTLFPPPSNRDALLNCGGSLQGRVALSSHPPSLAFPHEEGGEQSVKIRSSRCQNLCFFPVAQSACSPPPTSTAPQSPFALHVPCANCWNLPRRHWYRQTDKHTHRSTHTACCQPAQVSQGSANLSLPQTLLPSNPYR